MMTDDHPFLIATGFQLLDSFRQFAEGNVDSAGQGCEGKFFRLADIQKPGRDGIPESGCQLEG